MFPEASSKLKQLETGGGGEYQDELEHTSGVHSDDPSAIAAQEEASMVSQPSYVLEELQREQVEGDEYNDDNDLGYHQYDL